jgi:methionyl-tRNA synthetase
MHLGHPRSTYLPADIYTKYCKLRGYDAIYVCATDDHGTPIETKAREEEKTPEEFIKFFNQKDREDFEALGIEFDCFYKTHSPENERISNIFFKRLSEKGLVYHKPVFLTYCENDKRFLPDRFVKGKCPHCSAQDQYGDACEKCGKVYDPTQLIEPYCVICKQKPVKKESKQYFFKLSALSQKLENWLDSNKNLQKDVLAYVRNWLKDGLKDWDISREGPYFGFKIPGEESKFFYVWFDAPIGYVGATEKYCSERGNDFTYYWEDPSCETVHFIGKDIVYFHWLFWPAMLLESGFTSPHRIPTRGFINLQGEKMSKSRGNFILLEELCKRVDSDYLRYYLTAITPNNSSDGNFDFMELQARVNNELIANYGNFAYRVLSFIAKNYESKIPETTVKESEYDPVCKEFDSKINSFFEAVASELEEVNLKEGLEKIMQFSGECNKFFNERQPWKDKENAPLTLFLCCKAIYALSVALLPFTPKASKEILGQLQCEGKWGELSQIVPGRKLVGVKPPFRKIEDEEIKKAIEELLPEKSR